MVHQRLSIGAQPSTREREAAFNFPSLYSVARSMRVTENRADAKRQRRAPSGAGGIHELAIEGRWTSRTLVPVTICEPLLVPSDPD